MAAIRMLFSWLTEKGVLAMNPAREVKTERFSRTEGKTPAFVEGEVQKLLNAVEIFTHTGLRDCALLATLAYTFARIGSVVNLKVEDYYPSGKRFLLRFREKGGKEKELPVHHKLEQLLDQYLEATGLAKEPDSPLFPAALGKTGKLSRRPLARTDAADMLKRRLKDEVAIERISSLLSAGKVSILCGDMITPEMLAAINRTLDCPVSAFNMSNAIDYITDANALLRLFSGMRAANGAKVVTSSQRDELAELAGTFANPKVNDRRAFLELLSNETFRSNIGKLATGMT
jgi:hypothetical protein